MFDKLIEYVRYVIIGVEDGWLKIDNKIYESALWLKEIYDTLEAMNDE